MFPINSFRRSEIKHTPLKKLTDMRRTKSSPELNSRYELPQNAEQLALDTEDPSLAWLEYRIPQDVFAIRFLEDRNNVRQTADAVRQVLQRRAEHKDTADSIEPCVPSPRSMPQSPQSSFYSMSSGDEQWVTADEAPKQACVKKRRRNKQKLGVSTASSQELPQLQPKLTEEGRLANADHKSPIDPRFEMTAKFLEAKAEDYQSLAKGGNLLAAAKEILTLTQKISESYNSLSDKPESLGAQQWSSAIKEIEANKQRAQDLLDKMSHQDEAISKSGLKSCLQIRDYMGRSKTHQKLQAQLDELPKAKSAEDRLIRGSIASRINQLNFRKVEKSLHSESRGNYAGVCLVMGRINGTCDFDKLVEELATPQARARAQDYSVYRSYLTSVANELKKHSYAKRFLMMDRIQSHATLGNDLCGTLLADLFSREAMPAIFASRSSRCVASAARNGFKPAKAILPSFQNSCRARLYSPLLWFIRGSKEFSNHELESHKEAAYLGSYESQCFLKERRAKELSKSGLEPEQDLEWNYWRLVAGINDEVARSL